MSAKLIIYPPDQQGRRRVRYDGVAIGMAHRSADVRAFLAATLTLWSGGGPAPRRGNGFPDLPPWSARTRRALRLPVVRPAAPGMG